MPILKLSLNGHREIQFLIKIYMQEVPPGIETTKEHLHRGEISNLILSVLGQKLSLF